MQQQPLPSLPQATVQPQEIRPPGKKRRRSDVAPWHRLVIATAAKVREKYGPLDSVTAQHVVRTFKAALVPRRAPGPKVSKEVALAAEMRKAGKLWPQIYPAAFDNWDHMPFDTRSYRKFNLRRAVAAYLKRRRLRSTERRPNETTSPTV